MRLALHGLAFSILFLAGCAGSKEVKHEPMALGWVDRSIFAEPEHAAFKTTYDTVSVGADFVNLIQQVNKDVDVLVFFGSWCGDSKREVPRFLKVADQSGIPENHIKFYGLDRSKKSNDGMTDKYEIQLVPTLIFIKDGTEIGRIVERPRGTIEEDMLTILAGSQTK